MDKNSLVSIVLPVFNGEKYISQAIDSILSQIYQNWELIIVDDCSNDRTPSILNNYKERESRIRVIRNKKNQRLPESLNIGHSISNGDLITWTSDDNILKPSFLIDLIACMQKHQSDVVYARYDIIDTQGKIIRKSNLLPYDDLIFINTVGAAFLYKKEVFIRNAGYRRDLFLAEDYHFWLLAITHSRFATLDKNIYQYRIHEDSLTSAITKNNEHNMIYKSSIFNLYESFGEKMNWHLDSIKFLQKVHLNTEGVVNHFLQYRKIIKQDIRIYGQIATPETSQKVLKKVYHYTQRQLRRSKTERSFKMGLRILFCQPQIFMNSEYSPFTSFKLFIKTLLSK